MVRLPALGRPCTRRFRSAKPSFARRRILALQAARRQPAVLLRTPALDLRRPSDVVHDFGSVRGRAGRGAPERKRRPFCFCNGPADVKSPRVIVKPPSSRFCPWLALRPPHYAVRAARTEVAAYKLKLAVRFAVWSNSGQPAYGGFLDDSHPPDELDGLRRFLDRLESKELAIRRGPRDVTQKEIDILKREISHLERILARYKSGGQNA